MNQEVSLAPSLHLFYDDRQFLNELASANFCCVGIDGGPVCLNGDSIDGTSIVVSRKNADQIELPLSAKKYLLQWTSEWDLRKIKYGALDVQFINSVIVGSRMDDVDGVDSYVLGGYVDTAKMGEFSRFNRRVLTIVDPFEIPNKFSLELPHKGYAPDFSLEEEGLPQARIINFPVKGVSM